MCCHRLLDGNRRGGRAALAWARKLTADNGFDEDCETIVRVAETIDRIYGARF